jgi:hypothetical protein
MAGHPNPDVEVFNTIRGRLHRSEQPASFDAGAIPRGAAQLLAEHPSSISHAHFAALLSRLSQVAAKASADAMAVPVCAHDGYELRIVKRKDRAL